MQLPQNIGMGIGNNSLMDGQLLVSVDVLYKMWNDADLFNAIYDNQWVCNSAPSTRWGITNFAPATPGPRILSILHPVPTSAASLSRVDCVRCVYTQGLLAVSSQHRLSAGIGITDVLPGVDMDVMAGGMFRDQQQLGDATQTTIMSYWVGFGLTWRFGRGSCGSHCDAGDTCLDSN